MQRHAPHSKTLLRYRAEQASKTFDCGRLPIRRRAWPELSASLGPELSKTRRCSREPSRYERTPEDSCGLARVHAKFRPLCRAEARIQRGQR